VSECDQVKINNLDTCCEQAEEVTTLTIIIGVLPQYFYIYFPVVLFSFVCLEFVLCICAVFVFLCAGFIIGIVAVKPAG
jgi:hypothetical protein